MKIDSLKELFNRIKIALIITDIYGNIKMVNIQALQQISYLRGDESGDIENKNIIDVLSIDKNDFINHENIEFFKGNKKYVLVIDKVNICDEDYLLVTMEEISNNLLNPIQENILEKSTDGILVSDKDGRIILYNKAMEKLENKKSHDMIGKYLWDGYGYEGRDRSEHRQVLETGIPIINKYSAHAYDNGRPRYILYSTYPILIDGEIEGVFSISKNETKLYELLSETVELKRQLTLEEKECNKIDLKNGTTFEFSDIVGRSKETIKSIEEAQSVAWTDNNLLIIGDTGTGKEVFAQSIHNFTDRHSQPFIAINCSAIPENLLESILFGTKKGSYTGAIESKGLFREAGKGTLFLDELNSMPVNMQVKLLRVLQEREVRPIGSKDVYPIECRIVSAMNEDPQKLIKEGRLREDLFYRIAGFNLYLKSLKDKPEDILDLSYYFINNANKRFNKSIIRISQELEELLMGYSWPGNVRELQHFIENMMVIVSRDKDYLGIEDIPNYMKDIVIDYEFNKYYSEINRKGNLTELLEWIEKKIILEKLEENKGNVSQTARDLGIIRQSLIYRMKKLDIVNKS